MSSTLLFLLRLLLWVCARIPLTSTAVFFVYGLFFKREIGRWPVVYEDNIPESLKLLDQVALSVGAVFICSVPLALLSLLLLNSKLLKNTFIKCISFYSGSVLFMYLLIYISPLGSFVVWILD